ncbi:MAG: hypothetical protein AAF671_07675 [Pseudomonadota bacterium]
MRAITEQPLSEYVREQLIVRASEDGGKFTEDTLWYAGGVLLRFVETRQLFESKHESPTPVLALMYGQACTATTSSERINCLRRLGDTALFMGALFPDNFHRRGISKDYFVGMGGGAYGSLADQLPSQKSLFSELAERFPRLMQLLARVCERELGFEPQDILGLYERWRLTKSPEIQSQLSSLGIIPIDASPSCN